MNCYPFPVRFCNYSKGQNHPADLSKHSLLYLPPEFLILQVWSETPAFACVTSFQPMIHSGFRVPLWEPLLSTSLCSRFLSGASLLDKMCLVLALSPLFSASWPLHSSSNQPSFVQGYVKFMKIKLMKEESAVTPMAEMLLRMYSVLLYSFVKGEDWNSCWLLSLLKLRLWFQLDGGRSPWMPPLTAVFRDRGLGWRILKGTLKEDSLRVVKVQLWNESKEHQVEGVDIG